MRVIPEAATFTRPGNGLNHWVERLRVLSMSLGTYSIPAGGLDDQTPHGEDEIYVVMSGHGTLTTEDGTAEVEPGTVVYVPAAERHIFTDVTDNLTLLVVFAPASRAAGTGTTPAVARSGAAATPRMNRNIQLGNVFRQYYWTVKRFGLRRIAARGVGHQY